MSKMSLDERAHFWRRNLAVCAQVNGRTWPLPSASWKNIEKIAQKSYPRTWNLSLFIKLFQTNTFNGWFFLNLARNFKFQSKKSHYFLWIVAYFASCLPHVWILVRIHVLFTFWGHSYQTFQEFGKKPPNRLKKHLFSAIFKLTNPSGYYEQQNM